MLVLTVLMKYMLLKIYLWQHPLVLLILEILINNLVTVLVEFCSQLATIQVALMRISELSLILEMVALHYNNSLTLFTPKARKFNSIAPLILSSPKLLILIKSASTNSHMFKESINLPLLWKLSRISTTILSYLKDNLTSNQFANSFQGQTSNFYSMACMGRLVLMLKCYSDKFSKVISL